MVNDEKIVFEGGVEELPEICVEVGDKLSSLVKPISDEKDIIEALKLVFDPEVNVDVYNLGLIYKINLKKNGNVDIDMTLTSPTCPVAEEMPKWVASSVSDLEGVGKVKVRVVWVPAWDLSKISEEAKFQMDIGDLDFNFNVE